MCSTSSESELHTLASALTSCRYRARSACPLKRRRVHFTAYSIPSTRDRARYTSPNDPEPITLSTSKSDWNRDTPMPMPTPIPGREGAAAGPGVAAAAAAAAMGLRAAMGVPRCRECGWWCDEAAAADEGMLAAAAAAAWPL